MRRIDAPARPHAAVAVIVVGSGLGLLTTLTEIGTRHGGVALLALLALLSGVQGLRTD